MWIMNRFTNNSNEPKLKVDNYRIKMPSRSSR